MFDILSVSQDGYMEGCLGETKAAAFNEGLTNCPAAPTLNEGNWWEWLCNQIIYKYRVACLTISHTDFHPQLLMCSQKNFQLKDLAAVKRSKSTKLVRFQLGMAMRMRISASTSALYNNIAFYPTYIGKCGYPHRCASANISAWPSLMSTRQLESGVGFSSHCIKKHLLCEAADWR